MVTNLVTDTSEFFERKIRERGLTTETVIVVVVGVLGSLGTYYFAQRVLELTTDAGYTMFEAVGTIIIPLLGAVILWLGTAVVSHLVSGHYNGRGPLGRLVKLSAWTLIPIGIGNLGRTIAIYFSYNSLSSGDVDFGDANGFDSSATILRDAASNDVLVVASTGFLILSAVVMWYLLSYAVVAAKNLDLEDAKTVAAVPTGLFVVYLVWDLLGALGVL